MFRRREDTQLKRQLARSATENRALREKLAREIDIKRYQEQALQERRATIERLIEALRRYKAQLRAQNAQL